MRTRTVLTTCVLFTFATYSAGLTAAGVGRSFLHKQAAARGTTRMMVSGPGGADPQPHDDISSSQAEAVQRHDLGEGPAWLCNETACEETNVFLSTTPIDEEGVVCQLQEGLMLDGAPVWACGKVGASSPLLENQPAPPSPSDSADPS